MTISLDYNLEPSELRKLEECDLATVTRTEIDYDLFCGNIIFQVDDTVFDACWRWIPVLGFALQLYAIVADLHDGEQRVLEYTESTDCLVFQRFGSMVEVSASYTPDLARTSYEGLKNAVTTFVRRMVADFTSRWPTMRSNPIITSQGLEAMLGVS